MRPAPYSLPAMALSWLRPSIALLLLTLALFAESGLHGQTIDQVTENVNPAKLVALPNHHPQWANKSNNAGLLPADHPLEHLTLVLLRSSHQEQALQQLLAGQQDLASPDYHHWLTSAEMADRFGLSQHDITTITDWLRSQGLHVNWISPSRLFIGFGGTAGAVGQAFHTELHRYQTTATPANDRISVSSDPMIPSALAPAIKSVRGLYTVEDQPLHAFRAVRSDAPELTLSNGTHILAPSDFRTIYDEAKTDTTGQTIGIVGRSRTDFADFENFREKTGTNFPNPLEIVPTAFGGIDPGLALTAPPPATGSIADQLEATLDVTLAGAVANGAQLLLVVATAASGGIEADAQYLVQTSPVPAQVMSISFGGCESAAGPSGVAFWDTLFQQAAAEGISVFVSSGDSGASGCDQSFAPPPAAPQANSPNYICSSSYATCAGGTEFNDTTNSSQYWNATNDPSRASALGYIPEGGWNEPQTSSGASQAAASGGGVSTVIPTPPWQTGVPTARVGRYTPDIAFSAASHDGYFACVAAASASCVTGGDGGFAFGLFAGTSVAAPAMAGVAANLDALVGAPQGNLAPTLYKMAATAPTAFHDVTVASSGVANCDLATPSLCNNSLPGPATLTGGQPGYLVTAGYDQVTGLGSLDIANFLSNFPALPTIKVLNSPPSLAFYSMLLGYPLSGAVQVANGGTTPLDPITIAITGANSSDFTAVDNCQSTLDPAAQCAIQVTFTPSAAGNRTATLTLTSTNGSNSPKTVPLSGIGSTQLYVPTVNPVPSPPTITTVQPVTVTVTIIPAPGVPTTTTGAPIPATGSVTLSSGAYTSAAVTVSSNTAIIIPAGTLPLGADLLTATYIPDSAGAKVYAGASGSRFVTVTTVPVSGFTIAGTSLTVTQGATSANTENIDVTSTGGFAGSVALTAAITSAPVGNQSPPTFSFGNTSPVTITAGAPSFATLVISTTAPSTSNLVKPRLPWYTAGGAPLACLLLLVTPARWRRWRAMLGLGALLILFAGGMSACGGSGGNSSGGTKGGPGTSIGSYTVTITGTSGARTAKSTISLTIN